MNKEYNSFGKNWFVNYNYKDNSFKGIDIKIK